MPLRRVTVRKPRVRRFPNREDPNHLQRVRAMPCAIAGKRITVKLWRGAYPKERVRVAVIHICGGPIEVHHVTSRARGGHDRDTVPLCRDAHREYHQLGRIRFAEKWGLDVVALAKRISGAE